MRKIVSTCRKAKMKLRTEMWNWISCSIKLNLAFTIFLSIWKRFVCFKNQKWFFFCKFSFACFQKKSKGNFRIELDSAESKIKYDYNRDIDPWISWQIKPKFRLKLQFSIWFCTKRNSVRCEINRKNVIAIEIRAYNTRISHDSLFKVTTY